MELLFFILGMLFIQYLVPCLESLGSLFLIYIEAKRTKWKDVINQYEIKMNQDEILSDKKIGKSSTIGFQDSEENKEKDD